MNINESAPSGINRLFWVDNLRTVIIFLVVLYHVGGVYESAGLWAEFWIVDDPSTIVWVGIVGIMFDIFVMPTMFFISGFLVVTSLQNKTDWGFIKGKLRRLMVPWVIAVFTLIPIYKFIFLYSRNLPQEHWSNYFHFANQNSQNWLWFLPVLFLFNMIFLLLRKARLRFPNINIKMALLIASFIGIAYSFYIGGVLGFRTWTHTPFLDFENERLLLYFLTFLLGAMCFRQGLFAEKPKTKLLYNVINSIAWIPITAHIFARLYPFFYYEGFSVTPLYRILWWVSFYLSLVCLMYLMIESFRRYLNKSGSMWERLNKSSYGVYIIHVIMIGVFGTLLLNLAIPAEIKYPLLILSTYLVSNFAVWAYHTILFKIKTK